MGVHEAADGVLTRLEADRLRARALELVAELDTIPLVARAPETAAHELIAWAGRAQSVLAELARG